MKRFPSQLIHYSDKVMILDPRRLLITFREPIGRKNAEPTIHEYGLRFEEEDQLTGEVLPNSGELINHTEDRFWVRSEEPISEELLTQLEVHEQINWVSPVYRRTDLEGKSAYLSPLPNVLLIQFRENTSRRVRTRIERNYNLRNIEEKTKHLDPFWYYELPEEDDAGNRLYAYSLRDQIKEKEAKWVEDVCFESMPMVSPIAFIPSDTHFGQQWNMTRINAPDGWNLSTGINTVIIGVLDEGCDMSHPDLSFDGPGYNAGTGLNDGSAVGDHGTAVAGLVAATINNALGVAGVAGNCRVHSVAIPTWTEAAVAGAINEAANVAQVDVINMSFGWNGWNPALINPAITNAHNVRGVVLCAATHNYNSGTITYPATNPLVIAVGASDQNDERKRPTSPDGECWWGSNWGAELDVMSPGVLCWTTDRTGTAGYNQNGASVTLTSTDAPCLGPGGTLVYPTTGDAAGNYYANFNGTSAATPQVAGLAALLRSLYPTLTNVEVRNIIECTCEKVSAGVYAYAPNAAKPNGTWNNEMGYGRINVFHALDFADAYIKDNPADDGSVPFSGNFYGNSDILVRQSDDNVFSYQPAKRGQTNYIYVRVTNLGPATARNINVSVRAVPYTGTQFVYPNDWTTVDATHIQPTGILTSFATLASGANTIAKFSLSAAQVNDLYGWETGGWHPCLLTEARCDNDYGLPVGVHTWENNNLAQRNISTVPAASASSVLYPFVAGHKLNTERYMELVIDRHRLPRDIELFLDPWDIGKYFPTVELPLPTDQKLITFLDRTRLAISLCGCEGILTLEAGSTFQCREDISLQGAELVTQDGKRLAAIRADKAVIGFQKQPGEMRQMSLTFRVPDGAQPGEKYQIDITQRNTDRQAVGGVTLLVEVRE